MRGAVGGAVAFALAVVVVAACADDDRDPSEATPRPAVQPCDWPMWGQTVDRSFSYPCATAIGPDTVADLREIWFFNTRDVVTATPSVVGDTVYVGDWAGVFSSLDRDDGSVRWQYETEPHPGVYAGQIVTSAAVADVDGTQTVYFGGGKTLYALDTADGSVRWRHELNPDGGDDDPTEIESSPVVVDDLVVFGFDGHDEPGVAAGVTALDAATGEERWTFDPDEGRPPSGCVGVWGSPTVDRERGLVFAGSANCVTSPEGWGRFTEALFALDLDTGEPRWSFQPHTPNNDDFDFAGAPNLFPGADGRPLVGLGNKDAAYYAVDRDTGAAVWSTPVAEPGISVRGSNFSTGGFIGPAAYADGTIVGGTAVGGDPYLHALDAASGAIRWQQPIAAPTYAATAEAGGVVFSGGTDFTFRALALTTGAVLWEHEMPGVVAGGAAIVGDDVVAVAGIREPGTEGMSETAGVTLFSLSREPLESSSTTRTTAAASADDPAPSGPRPCVGTPCALPFTLIEPPPGTNPQMTLLVTLEPWRVEVTASGLGPPEAWVRPGSPAAAEGASRYALFISTRDDDPQGDLVCVLDADLACASGAVPEPGPTFNRMTLLAIDESEELPSAAQGINRLVTTVGFDPPLRPVG